MDSIKTIDGVKVVHCKDCRNASRMSGLQYYVWCEIYNCIHGIDWFCADGREKNDELCQHSQAETHDTTTDGNMTADEAVDIILNEISCVNTKDCDRVCGRCSLAMDEKDIVTAFNIAIDAIRTSLIEHQNRFDEIRQV